MRIATIPSNFQTSNFDHINKHYVTMNYTPVNMYAYDDELSYTSSDNVSYGSDKRGGAWQTSVSGDIYTTDFEKRFTWFRQGTYEAYGVTRIGPELEGGDQNILKDVKFKEEGLTGTWLGDVIGLMYKFSSAGSHNRDNCGLIERIGICYLNPFDSKIITYTAKHVVAGLGFASRPDDSQGTYECAVMLDTNQKNDVIDRKLKYVGIVINHYYKHSSLDHSLQGSIWNLRPIITHDTRTWDKVKDGFTLNGNASGNKIIVPHNSTTWDEFKSGSFQIKTIS